MNQNNYDDSTGYQIGKATGNNHFGNVYYSGNNSPNSSIPNNIPYRGVANFVGRFKGNVKTFGVVNNTHKSRTVKRSPGYLHHEKITTTR